MTPERTTAAELAGSRTTFNFITPHSCWTWIADRCDISFAIAAQPPGLALKRRRSSFFSCGENGALLKAGSNDLEL